MKKGVSFYPTDKTRRILDLYVKNSGYGSLSRTLEEIINSYDSVYDMIMNIPKAETTEQGNLWIKLLKVKIKSRLNKDE